jgi:hypothetical protein
MATPLQLGALTGRYVLVEEPAEETKAVVATPERPMVRARAHPALSRGLKGGKPTRAYLSYYSGISGAANTAFAARFGLTPNQDTSWASWADVFDEVRVVSAEAIFNTYYTTDPSAVPANSSNTIVVYDPTNTITLASVNAGLQFERYALMRNMIPATSGPKVSPMSHTSDGFGHFRVVIPKETQLSNVGTANSSGVWRPTADASTYDWGQFTCYTSVGGTSAVLRVEMFVRMLCEFRVRR